MHAEYKMAEYGQGSGNNLEGIDHTESQRILKEEQRKVGRQDLSVHFQNLEDDHDLEGPPLSMRDCKRLCNSEFVKDVLFRKSGKAKENTPLKLSDLQHVGLAKVIMQKFIEKERCMPNNNQVAIYFVQKLFCEQILRKQVDWDSRPTNAGVGRGRPGDRAAAKRENTEVERCKPVVLTQQVHMSMANKIVDLEAATNRIAALEEELQKSREETARWQAELQRYIQTYGILSPTAHVSPTFTLDEMESFLSQGRRDVPPS